MVLDRKYPHGVKTFINGVCRQCKYKSPGCQKDVELCMLSEITYYVRRMAIMLELALQGRFGDVKALQEQLGEIPELAKREEHE